VLDILREQGAPVGVKDILKEVVAFPFSIAERDVRTTLRGLIESGHVSLLKKRVQLFELSSQPDD
jgi:repressor of nif and glnA expression